MKIFLLFSLPLLPLGQAAAATIMETYSMTSSTLIPDADLSGIVQSIEVTTTNLASIDSVTVTLETTGGWNGDLYAYLWHDGVLSVLVNRPGRTASLPDGSPTSGMVLEFADAATTDLHLAPGALSGTFQPDGRTTHPSFSLDTDARLASLSLFNTSSPTGTWRLFVADVAGGEEATLTSWSATLTGQAIPEPGAISLAGLGMLLLVRRRERRRTM